MTLITHILVATTKEHSRGKQQFILDQKIPESGILQNQYQDQCSSTFSIPLSSPYSSANNFLRNLLRLSLNTLMVLPAILGSALQTLNFILYLSQFYITPSIRFIVASSIPMRTPPASPVYPYNHNYSTWKLISVPPTKSFTSYPKRNPQL